MFTNPAYPSPPPNMRGRMQGGDLLNNDRRLARDQDRLQGQPRSDEERAGAQAKVVIRITSRQYLAVRTDHNELIQHRRLAELVRSNDGA